MIVREIKKTSNPNMMNVVFEQEVPRPVTDLNSLLNFANAGNPDFGSNTQKRVGFFNFSPEMIKTLGFEAGKPVPAHLHATLVVHEFCQGDIIPEEIKSYYEGADTYFPRSWKENEGTPQEAVKTKMPKMTPKSEHRDQQVLTVGGKPIYRETHLAIMDMVRGDILIKHDNQVKGSTQALREASIRIGAPEIG